MVALSELLLFSNSDVSLWVTVDEDDAVGEDYRLNSSRIRRHSSDAFLVNIDQAEERKVTLDTSIIARNQDVSLSAQLDLAQVLDAGFTMSVTRKNPRPTPPGSVGTVVNDTSWTDSDVAASGSTSSSSYTPSNPVIIVSLGFGYDGATNGAPGITNITDTFSDTITWTQIVKRNNGATSGASGKEVWVGTGWSSGPGAITLVRDAIDTNMSRVEVLVNSVDGINTSAPSAESASSYGTSSTQSVTLGGIAADARSYGSIRSKQDDDGITPGTNENEIAEVATGSGGNRGRVQAQYGDLGTDTTVNWSALTTLENAAVAFEMQSAAAAAAVTSFARVTLGNSILGNFPSLTPGKEIR